MVPTPAFFFVRGVEGSSDSLLSPKLSVSFVISASSFDSSSSVRSFFFLRLSFYREGSALSVFFVFGADVTFRAAAVITVGSSTGGASLDTSATASLPGRCGSEVFISSSGFSFYGVFFGGGSKSRLDSPIDLGTNLLPSSYGSLPIWR